MQPYPPKGTLNPAAQQSPTTKAVEAPITVKVCSHMMQALGLKDGDVRELTIELSSDPWVFKQARIALDEACDCEEEA